MAVARRGLFFGVFASSINVLPGCQFFGQRPLYGVKDRLKEEAVL
jgi:hypothetical protein